MKQIDLPLYKFYLIEGMTQEDLNKLALERNNLSEEVYRLNNIINELEKYIKTDAKIELYKDVSGFRTFVDGQDLLNKLQELKGSDKECQ